MTATTENLTGLPEGAAIFDKPPDKIVVEGVTFQGRAAVNARTWYFDEDGPEWRPTKRGLCLTPELAEAVARAMLDKAGAAPGEKG